MSEKEKIVSSKKGQITLFVLIGIILLLTVLFFTFIRSESSTLNNDVVTRLSDFAEVAVVQSFVTSCLDELSEDALILAGNQGGYTDLSTVGAFSSYEDPTNADGFTFSQNSNIEIPYWHYLVSNNDCSGDCLFFSQRPRLEGASARSVEQQLKTYINRNFASCLQNFESFTDQGYTLSEDVADDKRAIDPIDLTSYPFTLSILFRNNDVKFVMDYPLTISQGDITDTVSTYSVTQNVPFRRMYTLASTLTAVELEYRYLESQTIELISLNSGIDRDKLPPLGGATNEFTSSIFWFVPDVQNNLQEILSVYTNAMRVQGTNNYREITFPDSAVKPALDRAFANMVIPLEDEDGLFTDLDVNYDYFGWPWYFNINSNGIIIEPESLSLDFFPFFGIQRFKHYYDVSNPVRVSVSHPTAMDGAGYTFAFGLENNVRNNEPLRESYADFVRPDVPNTTVSDNQQQVTLVCNQDQRNTDNVTITVVDKNTGDLLSGASISFTCGQETCGIGSSNEAGQYIGKLPICGGAYLSALKDNTVRGGVSISTSLGFSNAQEIELERIVTKQVSIKKYVLAKEFEQKFAKWIPLNRYTDLDVTEEAIVSFTRVEPNPDFDPYTTSVSFSGADGPNTVTTVRLVPGYYEVRIQAVLNEELIIPESRRTKSGKRFTIDEISMGKFPSGSISFDETTQYWHVTSDTIYSDAQIEFVYPASDLINVPLNLRVVEDLNKFDKLRTELIENNMTLFIPNIINE